MIAARKKTLIQELREDLANLPEYIAENKKSLKGVSLVLLFIAAMPLVVLNIPDRQFISDTAGTYIAFGTIIAAFVFAAVMYKLYYSKKE